MSDEQVEDFLRTAASLGNGPGEVNGDGGSNSEQRLSREVTGSKTPETYGASDLSRHADYPAHNHRTLLGYQLILAKQAWST